MFAYLRVLELIEAFGLQPTDKPLALGFLGRCRGLDFEKTTLRIWKKMIPAAAYTIREQAREIVIGGAVVLDFGGLDDQTNINKFNSAEYVFFCLDQAEECDRDAVAVLRGSLRFKIEGKPDPHYTELYTANPSPCWLRDEFVPVPKEPNARYIPALPTDNRHLPSDYIATLRGAFKHRPELLAAYLEGRWDVFGGERQIIRSEDVIAAQQIAFHLPYRFNFIACDPARGGNDCTVNYQFENTQVVKEEIYQHRDTPFTANSLFAMQRAAGGCVVAIDATGDIGGEITGLLLGMGVDVLCFYFGGISSNKASFLNIRAELWWRAGELFASNQVQAHATDVWAMSDTLKGDLTSPTYEWTKGGDGQIKVEDKTDIKERLGRSPDEGDAYVVGLGCYEYLAKGAYRNAPGVVWRSGKPAGAVHQTPAASARTLAGRNAIARAMSRGGNRWSP